MFDEVASLARDARYRASRAAEEMANVACCIARFAENRIDLTGDGRKSLFHEIAGLIDRPALTKTGVLFVTLS
jgi:hypothetical protein